MARRSHRRHRHELNAWPGYVDALSTLLMVVTFVLLVFVLGQQFLATALNRRTHSLDTLKQEVATLQHTLSLSTTHVEELERLTASLTSDRDAKQAEVTSLRQDAASHAQIALSDAALIKALQIQVAELNAQLAAISKALDVTQAQSAEKEARIAELGQKLNIALADKVNELKRYRSEFFEKLQKVLRNQSGIFIVGDRFVFQGAILFPTGSAELTSEGRKELTVLAATLHSVADRIPPDVPWLLRVDGHADRQPIHTTFSSNWELSSARAITVVKALIAEGIDPHHLAATGFSDYQPLDKGDTPSAYARNRRIEFRLTDR